MGFFHTYLNHVVTCATLLADSTQTIIFHKFIKTVINKQTNKLNSSRDGCAVIIAADTEEINPRYFS